MEDETDTVSLIASILKLSRPLNCAADTFPQRWSLEFFFTSWTQFKIRLDASNRAERHKSSNAPPWHLRNQPVSVLLNQRDEGWNWGCLPTRHLGSHAIICPSKCWPFSLYLRPLPFIPQHFYLSCNASLRLLPEALCFHSRKKKIHFHTDLITCQFQAQRPPPPCL